MLEEHTETADVEFYESCSDCMLMNHRTSQYRVMLSYSMNTLKHFILNCKFATESFFHSSHRVIELFGEVCTVIHFFQTFGESEKEGSHRDVEQRQAALDDQKKLADCLGFPLDKP